MRILVDTNILFSALVFPQFLPDAEVLLAEMSYELIPAVDHAEN